MKTRNVVVGVVAVAGLFMNGALAQHEEHHKDQAPSPSASAGDKIDTGKPDGMMSGGMMMGQNETGKLVDQLMKSFAEIEAEKDPKALQAKLAEHGSLLKELETKVQAQSYMMDMMQQMMGGSMRNGKMKGGATTGDENKK